MWLALTEGALRLSGVTWRVDLSMHGIRNFPVLPVLQLSVKVAQRSA